jgi:hypothetical protein
MVPIQDDDSGKTECSNIGRLLGLVRTFLWCALSIHIIRNVPMEDNSPGWCAPPSGARSLHQIVLIQDDCCVVNIQQKVHSMVAIQDDDSGNTECSNIGRLLRREYKKQNVPIQDDYCVVNIQQNVHSMVPIQDDDSGKTECSNIGRLLGLVRTFLW